MPDFNDRKDSGFSKYDTMSTEQLQQILREDASKPVGEESDTDMLFYVMEVLAKRRKARNEGKSPEEALETFKSKYYTENEISFISEDTPVAHKQGSGIGWRRGLAAAVAAVLVLVIGGAVTASAFGVALWDVIAKWTEETFHFGSVGQTEETNAPTPEFVNPCASLQEALSQYQITTALAPTWIPDGYVEVDVKVTESPKHRAFTAIYNSEDKTLRIRVADYLNDYPSQIEQSNSLIEIYSHNGVDYYIFNNYDQIKAVWIDEHYECYIIAPISVSEMKEIIDSIGKG